MPLKRDCHFVGARDEELEKQRNTVVSRGGAIISVDEERQMQIEEAVSAATADASALLSCLGQPVVAYHVTEIMRETDAAHARAMQLALMRRSIEALVDDGLENVEAERFASQFHGRIGLTWELLHPSSGASH
ncbi:MULTISPECIES: hypothetical protein [unclassified Mesorhizobium]|nr:MULTISPECIES: hypothetical protein [unclassified Mesorhizobium]